MATSASHRLLTTRDVEILGALALCPLTAAQLLAISQTFASPFTGERRLRQRLLQLEDAGRVHRRPYAVADHGVPNYYTLTPLGYRLLRGAEAPSPPKRMFDAVSLSRQHHTRSLADFLVHTVVSAHEAGIGFTNYYRENTLRLAIGEDALFPDAAFTLAERGASYVFYVEIDAATERIRSSKETDSWERKITLYNRLQDMSPQSFRVLAVSTRMSERPTHILEATATLVRNPQRPLVYGICLPEYLRQSDPLRAACFRDHLGNPAPLVPKRLFVPPASSPLSVRVSPHGGLPTLPTQALG
jgi:hypothetical protein